VQAAMTAIQPKSASAARPPVLPRFIPRVDVPKGPVSRLSVAQPAALRYFDAPSKGQYAGMVAAAGVGGEIKEAQGIVAGHSDSAMKEQIAVAALLRAGYTCEASAHPSYDVRVEMDGEWFEFDLKTVVVPGYIAAQGNPEVSRDYLREIVEHGISKEHEQGTSVLLDVSYLSPEERTFVKDVADDACAAIEMRVFCLDYRSGVGVLTNIS
jgi:hypothetical protein